MITIQHKKTGRMETLTPEQYEILKTTIGTSGAFRVLTTAQPIPKKKQLTQQPDAEAENQSNDEKQASIDAEL